MKIKNLFKKNKCKNEFESIFYKKSYSQDGEDLVLHAFYEHIPEYKGCFVDIGAHHPFRFSNTQFFYERGWRGINIDATPGSMKLFDKYRKEDINLEVGIAKEVGVMTYYLFNEPALNTFDKKRKEHLVDNTPYILADTVEINIMNINSVLGEYLPSNQIIDFMSIDVEGIDFEILQSLDFTKYSPEYLLVEFWDFDLDYIINSKEYHFLLDKGYLLVARTKRTSFFKRSEEAK